MEFFHSVLTATYNLFKTPFTIYGFTFSLFDVLVWSIVATLVLVFIRRIFIDGD